ncbi:peptidase [Cellulomonas sp. JZ18]|uniref:peptidase n=1 Tax=Cellulomonas sp. JZ18 TaxID=2654191 RepID=UPI0012D3F457|nr:peptidase [Cellulomonas sp. JZ18]QGQ19854.1 peptidase [Cellulomonas sp. JZ18]
MSTPDDLPRAPSGRIPQWVVDDARRADDARRGPGAPASPPTSWGVQDARRARGRRLVPLLVALLLASPLAVQLVRWVEAHPDLGSVWESLTASPGELRALGGPPPGQGEAPVPIGTPPSVDPAGGAYAFSATQVVDGVEVPVAWSPCRPIRYVVNPAGAPDGFAATVGAVMAEVTAATGLQVLDVGSTDEPVTTDRPAYQPDRYGERWAPVLLGFADESTEPLLAGDVAGLGGPATAERPDGVRVHVSGAVVLDAATLADPPLPDGTPSWLPTLRHEVAHVLGLDHVDDATQLMHPRRSHAVTTFQAGDRAGLAALGRGVCAPDL